VQWIQEETDLHRGDIRDRGIVSGGTEQHHPPQDDYLEPEEMVSRDELHVSYSYDEAVDGAVCEGQSVHERARVRVRAGEAGEGSQGQLFENFGDVG